MPLMELDRNSSTRSLDEEIGGKPTNIRAAMVLIRGLNLKAGSDSAARTAAAPRLTRLCEFEDEQLEAEYIRNEVRHVLESRTGHIAVATAGLIAGASCVNWAIARLVPSPEAPDWTVIWYGWFYAVVWLAYAGFTRTSARLGVSLARIEAGFVLLFVTTHIPGILVAGGLRETPIIGHSLIPMHQILIASLAAAYAPINVRHCAVIACVGTLGVALNTALMIVRDFRQQRSKFEVTERIFGWVILAVLESGVVFVSVRLNSSMRTAYAHSCAVEADASERELATAERERMIQHKAEVELKLGTAEAAKLARGRLIRMVMHDLRSPLLSVANAVSIVQDLEPETRVDHPVVVECHRAMATCSQLMQHIVSDMLDFERIDSGRLVLVQAPMRISQLLQAARDTFGRLARAKGVTLRLVPLAPDLDRAVFFGDLRRLQQCVNNGVSNSVKFTKAGGTVSIRARRGDAQAQAAKPQVGPATKSNSSNPAAPCALVVLEVDDSGSGLTADELRVLNLGEAFTQVGLGQMQGSGGTGLGLTIARDLLRLHGWHCPKPSAISPILTAQPLYCPSPLAPTFAMCNMHVPP
ncbi:histidine kinase-like ATPase [Pavlovales sp. CCMP2436]|nr:histidine kinase-like ATPase [Pavlovales sp. CCMP2436]